MLTVLVVALIVAVVVAILCFIIQTFLPVEPRFKQLFQLVIVAMGVLYIIVRLIGVSG